MSPRVLTLLLLLTAAIGVMTWTVKVGSLPPADFTYSNETEIKSLDPALNTGIPESRIMYALYDGLVRLGPKEQEPLPAVAERWDISEDGRTYTFHLRRDAKWSNGDDVTARDFMYSLRRVLDPTTACEYSYQAWYIENAEKYTKPSLGLEVGKPVEVELHERPDGAAPFARGQVLRGELTSIDIDPGAGDKADDPAEFSSTRSFVVEIDGEARRFRIADAAARFDDAEVCRQVLLDFSEVNYKALDDYTIEMTLNNPTPYWLQLVGFYTLFPVHQATIERYGAPDWTYPEHIVTNGPYRVAFRRLRDRLRMVKNEHFWDRDNVALETIDALAVESTITSFNLYATGEIDWVPKTDPLISRELLAEEPPRQDLNPAPQFTTYYYLLNVNKPPLDDVRVRQALAMAIDRQEIVATACAGEVPARSIVPPGVPGYESPLCPEENPEAARRLLAEAGYPEGRGFPKIDILYNTHESHQTIAELVRKQWQKNLGINVATRNEEWSTYNNSLRHHKFDVGRRAWVGDYIDPNTFLDQFLTGGENNDPDYSNSEFDKLIADAKVEADPEKRMQLLYRAEELLMNELPVLPVYFYVSRNLVRPRVQGFYNNLQDQHPLWALSIDDQAKANGYIPSSTQAAAQQRSATLTSGAAR